MTPKEALNLIKQFVPTVTEIRKVEFVTEPTVFGVGPEATIEWGDTTSYKEPNYRKPNLEDIQSKKTVEYMVDVGLWREATLIGIVYYSDEPLWILSRQDSGITHSRDCRIPE